VIKLRALTAYLIGRQLVATEQLDSWTDNVQVDLIWKPDEKGIYMGDLNYTATISFERFALVGSWLEANDEDREDLAAPTFAIDMLDDDLADVELTLQFSEPQYLAEDPAGEIEVYGKTWSAIPFELWVAESGEVVRHDSV
jgi:hypothetical protein